MAYLRGNPYIWSNGEYMYFNTPEESCAIPMDACDEFVAMRFIRLLVEEPERLAEIMKNAAEKHEGNFGADALVRIMGGTPLMDQIKQMVADKHPEWAQQIMNEPGIDDKAEDV